MSILVTDTLPGLRSLITLILRPEGFHVLEASTAAEALQIAATHPRPVSLLVASMGLPEMTGETLGRLLADLYPGLRTLCLSGYPQAHLVSLGILEPATPFLGKPFKIADLLSKVWELIDAAPVTVRTIHFQPA
jgi:two-component system cell cycle sensor histidine kinase/response regulator CckA